uniref:Protein hunchback n=1 Tax=Syphacia muris TaxID=451379 RepID=A0A0N5AYT3_9BILA
LKTAKNGGFDKLHCSQYSFNDNNAEKSDKLPSVLVEENTLCQNNREVLTSAPNSSANPTSSATSCTVSSHTTSSPPFLHSSSPQLEAASNTTRSTFCRAPGLGPVSIPEGHPGTQHPLVCQICGFSCNSKFHYNSHMNTHGDHQCTMCDYTSRTEGRLKKHMRDSHTVEQQIAAGLEIDSSQRSVTPSNLKKSSSQSLSTSVASLLENASSLCVNGPVTDDSSPNGVSFKMLFVDSIISLQREEPSTSGVNSERRSSKPKNYKCKQCNQVSTSKEEQWIHARSHIPAEKRLECNRCGFVTEYKHHLEYHLRNHVGSKPFQCRKCAYSCVNKSMLNSHMKSHTNIYQFRCRDCSYATKYCHSLKLHLKKYNHNRAGDSNDGGGIDSGQIDPVNVLNAAFRMNALQSISTAGSVLPPHCHFCSYQPSSVDEGLRHQMMHIITGSSVPTSSGAISKELKLFCFL